MIKLADIEAAAKRIAPFVQPTPIFCSKVLSQACSAEVVLKCENFQRIGAFKFRGACNAVFLLPDTVDAVATHSSGNHGAALALAATERGIKSYIVMPDNAVPLKRDNVIRSGGIVIGCGPGMHARETALKEIQQQTGAEIVHPFNDERVMAGQGTAALELLRDCPDLEVLLAPVGGGGLLSGCAVVAKSINPDIRVIGVEPLNADDTKRSFDSGERLEVDNPDTIADGLRATVGVLTFPVIRQYVDDIVTVTEANIIAATHYALEELKLVMEPSAATVIAALRDSTQFAGKKVGAIISGGNLDLRALLKI